MQVSTHRDPCTLVESIYRDALVLELDNRTCISTVQYSTVQYGSTNIQVSTHRDQCTLLGSIYIQNVKKIKKINLIRRVVRTINSHN